MPTFSKFSDIEAYLQKQISEVLNSEVKEAVKDIMQNKIDEVVYGSYDPVQYERRGLNGGLMADENIVGHTEGTSLIVENVTPFSQNPASGNIGSDLAGLVEYGDGWNGHQYDYQVKDGEYLNPRPFIQRTRDELKSSSTIRDAIKRGLRKRGVKTIR